MENAALLVMSYLWVSLAKAPPTALRQDAEGGQIDLVWLMPGRPTTVLR